MIRFQQIRRGVERERQLGCAGAEEARVKFHAQLLLPQLRRADVAGMLRNMN